jgi:dihydroorotate dehydrogenase
MSFLWKSLGRPLMFSLPPETAHHLGITALKFLGTRALRSSVNSQFSVYDPALKVNLSGLKFPNPVGLAAGFDKNAEALHGLESLGFGFLEAGTLTPRPQPGNPTPRIFRLPKDQALVNRLGFNNVGASTVAHRFTDLFSYECPDDGEAHDHDVAVAAQKKVGGHLGIPLGINIGKNKDTPMEEAASDYIFCLELLHPWAQFFVVNISSPNTPGLRGLQSPKDLEALLSALKKKNDALAEETAGVHRPPLFVKLSPDEEHGEETVDIVARCGFAGIVATNTTRSREGLITDVPTDGGLSGKPLRVRSTEMVRRLYKAAKGRLHIIGVGGIFTAEDAYEKILAGASLVEVYTGFIYQGMSIARDINLGLLELLKKDGFESISEAVGKKA